MDTKFKTEDDVFGTVLQSSPLDLEDTEISEEKLKEPLFYEESVVRCFCFNCGTSTELTAEGAIELAKKAEIDVLLSWNGFYFTSKECIVCGKDYKNPLLKKIS